MGETIYTFMSSLGERYSRNGSSVILLHVLEVETCYQTKTAPGLRGLWAKQLHPLLNWWPLSRIPGSEDGSSPLSNSAQCHPLQGIMGPKPKLLRVGRLPEQVSGLLGPP